MDDKFKNGRAPVTATEPIKAVFKWWAMVPPSYRPVNLVKAYPRIVNTIALCWDNSNECEAYLSSLILNTDRSTREGFPQDIAAEILALYNYRTRETATAHEKVDAMFDFNFGPLRDAAINWKK